jgi:transcriptional regulator with XRE-family HTH domain
MTIGGWVRAARLSKGWTLAQLGSAVGCSRSNVAHWEAGRHVPSFDQVLAISTAAGYPMPGSGPAVVSGQSVDPGEPGFTEDQKQQVLADLADLVPEELQRVIIDIHERAKLARWIRDVLMRRVTPRSPRRRR